MPTLISNHKKRVVETKLQKAYSVISQAMKFSEIEHSDSDNWDFSVLLSNTPDAYDQIDNEYFSKYLKNCHTIKKGVNNYRSGVHITRNQYYQCSGFNIISFPIAEGEGVEQLYKVPSYLFIILINVTNPNNKILGKTEFQFIYQSNQLYAGGMHIVGRNPHARLAEDEIIYGKCEQPIGQDTGGYTYKGEACATVIQRNGWKIPDDYPIKF